MAFGNALDPSITKSLSRNGLTTLSDAFFEEGLGHFGVLGGLFVEAEHVFFALRSDAHGTNHVKRCEPRTVEIDHDQIYLGEPPIGPFLEQSFSRIDELARDWLLKMPTCSAISGKTSA